MSKARVKASSGRGATIGDRMIVPSALKRKYNISQPDPLEISFNGNKDSMISIIFSIQSKVYRRILGNFIRTSSHLISSPVRQPVRLFRHLKNTMATK